MSHHMIVLVLQLQKKMAQTEFQPFHWSQYQIKIHETEYVIAAHILQVELHLATGKNI